LATFRVKEMKIYLAGGGSGNCSFIWKGNTELEAMKIFLAGIYTRPYLYDDMKMYLAGNDGYRKERLFIENKISILESFFYLEKHQWMFPYIEHGHWDFLLDSGAFTFMVDQKTSVNWDEYIVRYCDFVTKYKVDKFFELDIDSVVGIKEVERLRKKIEKLTGAQPIPVWHKSRGMDYWKGMVKDYKYVAIGGIVTREIKLNEHPIFANLIAIAKDAGAKVHGLGYTNLKGIERYKFDSVDSTSWLYGNRKGSVFKFNGRTIVDIPKPPGTRLMSREVAINNFREWIKFQKYAEKHL